MGTNFYALLPNGETVHLGKRSVGWRFNFQATGYFRSTRELSGWLENTPVTIQDEYGDNHDPVEWFRMAVDWCKEWDRSRQHPAQVELGGHRHGRSCWCGPDPSIHGRPRPDLDILQYVDLESDTDWTEYEFS